MLRNVPLLTCFILLYFYKAGRKGLASIISSRSCDYKDRVTLLAITKSTNPNRRSQYCWWHETRDSDQGMVCSSAGLSVAATCDGMTVCGRIVFCCRDPCYIHLHTEHILCHTIYIPAFVGAEASEGSKFPASPTDRSEPSEPVWPCNSIWGTIKCPASGLKSAVRPAMREANN